MRRRDGILLSTGWACGGITYTHTNGALTQLLLAIAVGLLTGLTLALVDTPSRRCILCGDPARGRYCHAHSWAAGSRLRNRPAGTLETVTSLSSPVGRSPSSLIPCESAGNRQSREERRG